MRGPLAFVAGLIFAIGLGLSGMTDANKVIGFLDLSPSWDPSLAMVMMGAIGVHLPLYAWIRSRERPLLSPQFSVPAPGGVDRRLIAGAAIFGIGWGLGGFCPGPAVVSLASGRLAPLVFVVAASLGMAAYHAAEAAARWRSVEEDAEVEPTEA